VGALWGPRSKCSSSGLEGVLLYRTFPSGMERPLGIPRVAIDVHAQFLPLGARGHSGERRADSRKSQDCDESAAASLVVLGKEVEPDSQLCPTRGA
jgi:hypothetical protein